MNITLGRNITVAVTIAAILVWKTVLKSRHHVDSHVARRVAISTLCLTIAVLSAAIQPVNFIFHALGIFLVQQGLLFAYIVAETVHGRQKYYHFWQNKYYLLYTGLSLIVVFLDYTRKDTNFGSFLDNDYFHRDLTYYLSYTIHYGLSFFIMGMVVEIDEGDIKNRKIPILAYKVRRYMTIYGFKFGMIAMLIVIININISYLFTDIYRDDINNIYSLVRTIFVLLIITGTGGHEIIFKVLAYPIVKIRSNQSLENQKILRDFHQKINEVVRAYLPNPDLSEYRIIYEISDIRDNILSHFHIAKLNPFEEAQAFVESLGSDSSTKFNQPGPHKVIQVPDNEDEYYLNVAKHFFRLQQMNKGRL